MSNPDPISSALVKGGVEQGMAAAKGLLEKLCGPAVEEIGLLLQDRVRVYRLKNQLRMLGKVQAMLKDGDEIHAVPLRTLLPLLEGASLEDNDELSNKWAGLLASAASSGDMSLTHPGFPRILSEMSPQEALILDKLYKIDTETEWQPFRNELVKEFGTSQDSIDQAYGNLFRLGLCLITNKPSTLLKNQKSFAQQSTIQLSSFGRFFLSAAYGPAVKL